MEEQNEKSVEDLGKEIRSRFTEMAEFYSQNYVDPAEREDPIQVIVILIFCGLVDISQNTYDLAKFQLDVHRKTQFPGFMYVIDPVAGGVLDKSENGYASVLTEPVTVGMPEETEEERNNENPS